MRRAHGKRKTVGPALLAVLLLPPSAVQAQPPAAPAGDGSLARAGCLSVEGRPSCRPARALGRPRGVALSPSGTSVYVTSARSDGVAVFRRNRRTGALRQLRGRAGCVRNGGGRGCGRAHALRGPSAIAVSPDGRTVYVASGASGSIAAFGRSRRTGALRQLRGRAGCIADRPRAGCRNGRALTAPSRLAVSPGGRHVYAASRDGIAVLRRDARTGGLAQLAGRGGCVTSSGMEGCAAGRAIGQGADIGLDRDGSHLYATSPGDKAVAIFEVSAGALRQAAGPEGCISDQGAGGCAVARTLNGAAGLAVSSNGLQVYSTAEFSGAVAILARDPMGGLLSQPPGPLGCIRDGGGLDCAAARFMGHPDQIELSRDGRSAYVRAETGDLVVLRRDRGTGELSQLPGSAGCIADGNPECTDSGGLNLGAMALSRDGRNAYVTSDSRGGAIAVYRRAR